MHLGMHPRENIKLALEPTRSINPAVDAAVALGDLRVFSPGVRSHPMRAKARESYSTSSAETLG